MSKPHEYMRCCLCGRLRRYRTFDDLPTMFSPYHEFDVCVQHIVNGPGWGNGGMVWGQRPMTKYELQAIEKLLVEILDRVRTKIEELE